MFLHSAISAGTYLAAKRALAELGPFELALVRFLLSSGVYAGLVWRSGRRPARADLPRIAFMGLLGVGLNQVLFLAGMRHTTAGHGALLYALSPAFVFLLALALGTERLRAPRVAGLLLAFGGTAVVLGSRGQLEGAGSLLRGDLVVLLAVMAWAGFATGTKPLAERYGARVGTGAPLLVGTAMYLPVGLLAGDLDRFRGLSPGGWGAVVYLVVMTNVVSWMMYAWALARAEASRVAVWSNLQPVLTALLAWWAFGERLTAPFLLGGALVVAGVLLTQRA